MTAATSMFPAFLIEKLSNSRLVAVLVIDDADAAVPLAKALLDGGVDIMELTLRTPAAVAALRQIKSKVPEMTAGIGTVLNCDQVAEVAAAGAAFAVAPGFNPRVLAAAAAVGLPFAPGICTPTGIELAAEAGCRVLKFFPAEPLGGLKTIAAMAAPYAHLGIKYIPLGGVDQENLGEYLKNPNIIAVGGSWLAKRDEIANHEWQKITAKAQAATAVIESI